MVGDFRMNKSTQILVAASFLSVICTSCTFSGPNLAKLDTEGDAFVKDAVQQIGEHWSSKAFLERADDATKAGGDPSALFNLIGSKLGPLKRIDTVKREDFRASAGVSIGSKQPDYIANYSSKIECKSGPALATLTVIHLDNRWCITSFHVDSKLLRDFNKPEQLESKAYAERLLPAICQNLSVDVLKQNAVPKLRKDLEPLPFAASLLALKKTLGQFKSCENVTYRTCSMIDGQYAYDYVADANFEHGPAKVTIVAVKFNGEWKLRAFNIQGHS